MQHCQQVFGHQKRLMGETETYTHSFPLESLVPVVESLDFGLVHSVIELRPAPMLATIVDWRGLLSIVQFNCARARETWFGLLERLADGATAVALSTIYAALSCIEYSTRWINDLPPFEEPEAPPEGLGELW